MTTEATKNEAENVSPSDATTGANVETPQPYENGTDAAVDQSAAGEVGTTPESEETVTFEDLKEAAIDTGVRLREAGLGTLLTPLKEGLGNLTRKAFRGLGALLDEIDDKKTK